MWYLSHFLQVYRFFIGEYSIFTYYLLKGLRGDKESVDNEGNVTPQSLGNYVVRAIMSLPPDERPRQRPIIKAEESGNVILVSYPDLRTPPPPSPITPLSSNPPTKRSLDQVHMFTADQDPVYPGS
jgi:hypothetical protein